jgi:hypothetical protein
MLGIHTRFTLAISVGLIVSSCKFIQPSSRIENRSNVKRDLARTTGKFRVLVVDDGFDVTLPVFQGKILATYSYLCDNHEAVDERKASSFEEFKRTKIEQLTKSESTTCRFTENVDLIKSPALKKVRPYKEEWNNVYLQGLSRNIQDSSTGSTPSTEVNPNDNGMSSVGFGLHGNSLALQKTKHFTQEQIDELRFILSGEGKYNYHGTKVASLIAYNNPNVELVFVNIKLRTGEAKKVEKCPTQQDIDWETRLYSDNEFLAAAMAQKLDAVTSQIYKMIEKYDFDFINASFGEAPVSKREQLLQESGCGAIRLGENRKAQSLFEQLIDKHRKSQGVGNFKAITILALGNDTVQMDSLEDGEECGAIDTITVASTDYDGNIADFSNRGKCADVFVPGKNIIAAAPENFLIDLSGTSFSAPLFVRYLTLSQNKSHSYAELFKRYRRSQTRISRQEFPEELMYESAKPIGAFRLTDRSRDHFVGRPAPVGPQPWK